MPLTARAQHSFDVRQNQADSEAAMNGARMAKRRQRLEQEHIGGSHEATPHERCPACEEARIARVKTASRMRERLANAILRNPSLLKTLRSL
jgi:hypothetical protein